MKKLILSLVGLAMGVTAYGQCITSTPATLPYVENFNGLSGTINSDSTFICSPSASWDFQSPATSAVLEQGVPSGTSGITGDFQGTSLGMASVVTSDTANLILTINLSALNTSDPEDIWLNFYYADFADEDSPADQVFLRGSNADSWITVFDWNDGSPNAWQVGRLKIDSALSANGQNFSASTQIRFSQVDNVGLTGGDGFGLDQVSIESNNTSFPNAVSLTNITSSTVDVAWTGVGPNTQIAIGTLGFYWPSASPQNFSAVNNTTLTGLTPATTYQLYLRDSTATGDVSLWQGPFTFQTNCVPFTAPYSTNFDATADGDVESCWAQYTSGSPSSYARVEALSTFNATQPFSGANVLEMYNFNNTAGDTLVAISPEFSDLSAGNKQIRFQLATNDANVDLLVATLSSNALGASVSFIDTIDIVSANTWQEVIIPINSANGYNGSDAFIGLIHSNGGGTFDDIYIDDFNYELIPACPKVTNVQFANILASGTDINFNASGDSLQIEWGPTGFSQGTGCLVEAANNGQLTLNGASNPSCVQSFSPQTTYDVYLRSNCTTTGDGFSVWDGPFTFTTACAPVSAPYSENFDSWTPGSSSTSSITDSISPCWTRSPDAGSGSYIWLTEDDDANSSGTGPNTDNSGSGNYLYTEASSGSAGDEAFLYSPFIDVSGLSSPYLQFYLHAVGDDLDTLEVQYFNNGNWMSLVTVVGAQQTAISDPFSLFADTISGLTGSLTQIRFRAVRGSSFEGDWSIDDFSIIEAPSCTPSSFFVSDSVDASTIYTSWTAGSGTSFIVNADTVGFTPGTGRFGDTTTLTNAAITGLMPTTQYELYLRDVCGGSNGSSPWVGPISVLTGCPAVFSTPALVNVEGLATGNRVDFENCWSTDRTSNPRWEVEDATGANENSTGTGPFYDHTSFGTAGGNYWFLETSGGSLGDEAELTSTAYDLGALTQPSLYFWYHMFGDDMGNLHVDIESGGQWYNDYFVLTGEQDTSGADDWNQAELNLADFVNDTIRIRFRGERGNGFTSDMSIDDIELAEATSCNLPVNLQAFNTTSNSSDVSWSSYNSTFNIIWGPAGFNQGTGTAGTTISGQSSPINISGLSPNTFYDVYVEDPCNPGVLAGPLTIKTPCLSALAAGTYTIGSAPTDDFPSFDSVATLLNGCGIGGTVVFNVQPGSYTDKLHLQFVPGVSSTSTITFNGTGGNDSLIFNGQSFQTAVLIEGTSYVTLNNMTIVNSGASESFGILLKDGSDSVTISNNTILMDTTSTSTFNDIVGILTASVYDNDNSEGSEVDYLTIQGNTIIGGITGINLEGNATGDFSLGHRIIGNHISRQNTYGVYVDELEDFELIGNTIDNPRGTTDGFYAFDLNDFRIVENAIYVSDYGLYVSDGNDGFLPATRSTIINNMVSSSTDYGIYLSDFENVEVYHNSAYGAPAMAINDQDSVWVINNVFVSDNDFAFESFDNFTGVETIDYNLYESGNSNAFDIGTASYTDLAAWQAGDATNNVNSLYGDPVFLDKLADLHVVGVLANDAGDNSLGILTDIDGDARPQSPSTTVDMGADEFTPLTDDAELMEIITEVGCGDSTTAVSLVFRNLGQNTLTSLPLSATISGGVNSVITNTYTGSLASLAIDTLTVGTFNTYAGAQGVIIDGALALAGDQDASNDSLQVGPFDYTPFEPIGFDSSYCAVEDTAFLRANPLNGIRYAWFASNNTVTDTVPIGEDDTLKVATAGAQSTYFLSYASAEASLNTPFVGGNGLDGNAFDIQASSNIEMTGVDLNVDGSGSVDVMVFIRNGTYVGNATSLTGWTRIDSLTVTAAGAGNPTFVPFTNSVQLSAGSTYGMITVLVSGSVDYTNGSGVGTVQAQNSDLTIFEGSGISWPLASDIASRIWNGRIYYQADACSDIRVPVNLTQGIDTATASFTVSGTQPTFNFDASASLNADVYTWDFGDGNTGSGVTASNTYANNGSYTVVLTVDDTTDCASVAVDSMTVNVTIGLEENPLSQSLAVYPNPASDFVQVSFDVVNSADASIRLFDTQGRILIEQNEKAQGAAFSSKLELGTIASGVYVLEIESGDLKTQRRISVR